MNDAGEAGRATGRGGRRRERWWLVGVAVWVGGFYIWTARHEGVSWNFGQRQTDYYNLLVDGFLDGHLHMKVEVPEELRRLADPYNPSTRPPGLALHDASMYRGRYYLYFGAAPVVTLVLPFRVLTGGVALPLPAAVLVFTYAGFLVSAGILLGMRRRYFPEASGAVVVLGVLALGTASMGPLLVLRGSIWELPLSSGYFFVMVALGGVWRAVHAERRGAWWVAGAGLGLGLAVASRPTYLFTSGLLVVPVVWQWWRSRGAGRAGWRKVATWALAGAVPLGTVGLAMAWYNFARFGSPTEFGVAYQLSGVFEAETRHFSGSYLAFNAEMYGASAVEWTRYFPFFQRMETPAVPVGHLGFDDVYGVLWNLPLVWLAGLAPLALWRREAEARGRLGAGLGASALLAAGALTVLLFFYAAMARYGADFLPAVLVLACTGAMALERWVRGREWQRSGRGAVWVGTLGVMGCSVFFALMLSCEAYGNLRRLSPGAYARIATWLNHPTAWAERIAGTEHGPVEVELRWPTRWPAAGTRERLVSTGAFAAGDQIFVQYEAPGGLRIGFSHDGGTSELSRIMAAGANDRRRLRVEMGSLYPPEEYPFQTTMAKERAQRLSRRLRVELDGEVLLESYQRFHRASPADVRVGHGREAARVEGKFSGEILGVKRDVNVAASGDEVAERQVVRAQMDERGAGTKQPLLSVGSGERGGVWYVTTRGAGAWAVGFATETGERWEADPVAADLARAHEIEITTLTRRGEARTVFVKLDGVIAGTWRTPIAQAGGAAEVGKNLTAVSDVAATFAGIIYRTGADGAGDEFDTVRLTLKFPSRWGGGREPLVVTGETGRGDFLQVDYLEDGRVRFGLDHWGKATVFSAPVRLDFAATQVIDVSLESFPGARRGALREPKQIRVAVNGREVWTQEARLFAVEARDVFVGRNPLGGTACGPWFTGSMLKVERLRTRDGTR